MVSSSGSANPLGLCGKCGNRDRLDLLRTVARADATFWVPSGDLSNSANLKFSLEAKVALAITKKLTLRIVRQIDVNE